MEFGAKVADRNARAARANMHTPKAVDHVRCEITGAASLRASAAPSLSSIPRAVRNDHGFAPAPFAVSRSIRTRIAAGLEAW